MCNAVPWAESLPCKESIFPEEASDFSRALLPEHGSDSQTLEDTLQLFHQDQSFMTTSS